MQNSELSSKVSSIEEFAEKFPSEETRGFAARVKEAFKNYTSELAKGTAGNPDSYKTEIVQLEQEFLPLAIKKLSEKKEPSKLRVLAGQGLLVLVFITIMYFIYWYGGSVGVDNLLTIKGTRPILVVAAIVSTIVFGGSILMGSLFSSDAPFEDRLKHAREVFLVFSGIFGMVIGFYFGASNEVKKSEPEPQKTAQVETVAKSPSSSPEEEMLAEKGLEDKKL